MTACPSPSCPQGQLYPSIDRPTTLECSACLRHYSQSNGQLYLAPSPEVGRPRALKPLEEFELRQFREAGVTLSDCAKYFDVSKATVCRVLAKQREKFGPEKLSRKDLRA